jgi:hypothetical protein
MDDIAVLGEYEKLDTRIDNNLQAKTTADLYQVVIRRLQEDYDEENRGIVESFMNLLWASQRGLTERELKELMGRGRAGFREEDWAPLFLAMEDMLFKSGDSGLLNFSDSDFKLAVERQFITDSQKRIFAHEVRASLFWFFFWGNPWRFFRFFLLIRVLGYCQLLCRARRYLSLPPCPPIPPSSYPSFFHLLSPSFFHLSSIFFPSPFSFLLPPSSFLHPTILGYDQRKVEELPWQISKIDSPKRLKEVISDLNLFLELYKHQELKFYLIRWWRDLEKYVTYFYL